MDSDCRILAGGDVVIDGFTVEKSNRILWRTVVNDANVGPWELLDGVKEHSLEGLRRWMHRRPGYDFEKVQREGWDHHVYAHGLRMQFWIPFPNEGMKPGIQVVCVDAFGLEGLTEGKVYNVDALDGDLFVLVDDNGEKGEFLIERFRKGVK